MSLYNRFLRFFFILAIFISSLDLISFFRFFVSRYLLNSWTTTLYETFYLFLLMKSFYLTLSGDFSEYVMLYYKNFLWLMKQCCFRMAFIFILLLENKLVGLLSFIFLWGMYRVCGACLWIVRGVAGGLNIFLCFILSLPRQPWLAALICLSSFFSSSSIKKGKACYFYIPFLLFLYEVENLFRFLLGLLLLY